MKRLKTAVRSIKEIDLFSSQVAVRYQADNDYKTLTGACISMAVLIFLSVVFINSFITMLNRTDIVTTTVHDEEEDPSYYNLEMSKFMFAVQLNNIDLNSGLRYFNIKAQQIYIINGVKTKTNIVFIPCQSSFWSRLDPSFQSVFTKLSLQKAVCPSPTDTLIELQGKYTSDAFKYVKISFGNCSGIVDGRGCRSDAEITSFLATYEVFSMNFYFTNILLNPQSSKPSTYYFEDTNNFPFSINVGTSCNFFLQSYNMKTDTSLLPYQIWEEQIGGLARQTATMTTYKATKNQYMRFYIRKGPVKLQITRQYFALDDLLSYVGGLFGLIVMVIQIPLYYYNICCCELSMSNDIFSYPPDISKSIIGDDKSSDNSDHRAKDIKLERSETPQKSDTTDFIIGGSQKHLQTIDYSSDVGGTVKKKSAENLQLQQEKQDLHSLDKFNFFWFLLYFPFFAFKRMGWKSLQNKKLTPYYKSIQEIRKQIDVLNILKKFLFLDRVIKALLDPEQRMLLHIKQKQNINQLSKQRKGFGYHRKMMAEPESEESFSGFMPTIFRRNTSKVSADNDELNKEPVFASDVSLKDQSTLKASIQSKLRDTQTSIKNTSSGLLEQSQFDKLRAAYQRLCTRTDAPSRRLLMRLEPNAVKKLSSASERGWAKGLDEHILQEQVEQSVQEKEEEDQGLAFGRKQYDESQATSPIKLKSSTLNLIGNGGISYDNSILEAKSK